MDMAYLKYDMRWKSMIVNLNLIGKMTLLRLNSSSLTK